MSSCLWLVILLFYMLVPFKRSLHMIQQNRYQSGRYRAWLWDFIHLEKRQTLRQISAIVPLCVFALLPDTTAIRMVGCLCYGLYGWMWWYREQKQTYVKKLVVTHRIRRLALAQMAILLVIFLFGKMLIERKLRLLLIPFSFFLPWGTLFIALWLLTPVEQRIRTWYVNDAKQMLAQRDELMRIAITGSYGKTSVKHILASLLSQQYYTYKTPHSYNNLMGLTLSIRTQLQPLHQVFVAEMGVDHVGEMEPLADLVQPSIAIITAIGPQHLSTFGSQENIVKEKMHLVERLPQDGIAILNVDNPWIRAYPLDHPDTIVTYGIHEEGAMVKAVNIRYQPSGTEFEVVTKQERFALSTRLLGEHNVCNILGAVACALTLHVPSEKIIAAVKQLPYTEHRLQAIDMGTYTLLDDAYNSNPEGASYALDVLAAMNGIRFLLTPGFLDLGKATAAAHRAYAKKMAQCADEIILIGKIQTADIAAGLREVSFPHEHIHIVSTTAQALAYLREHVHQGDCALIENDLPDAFNH